MKQRMKDFRQWVNDSAIEAARVDGASYLKIFTNIILPQIKGGLLPKFIRLGNNVKPALTKILHLQKTPDAI